MTDDVIRRLVEAAPPLTKEQSHRLRHLLAVDQITSESTKRRTASRTAADVVAEA